MRRDLKKRKYTQLQTKKSLNGWGFLNLQKIDSDEFAQKCIEEGIWGTLGIVGITIVVGVLLLAFSGSNPDLALGFLEDAVLLIFFVVLFLIWRGKASAVALVVIASVEVVGTVLAALGIIQAGRNIILSLVYWVAAYNLMRATFYLKNKPTPPLAQRRIGPNMRSAMHHTSPRFGLKVLFTILLIFGGILLFYLPAVVYLWSYAPHVQLITTDSMQHNWTLDDWWSTQRLEYAKYGITKEAFQKYPFPDGIDQGTVAIYEEAPVKDLRVGDVIIQAFFNDDNETHEATRIVRLNHTESLADENYARNNLIIEVKGDRDEKSAVDQFGLPRTGTAWRVIKFIH